MGLGNYQNVIFQDNPETFFKCASNGSVTGVFRPKCRMSFTENWTECKQALDEILETCAGSAQVVKNSSCQGAKLLFLEAEREGQLKCWSGQSQQ